MRILLLVPLVLTAACNVNNDPQNDQVTVQYNEEDIRNTAEDVGNTAENIGAAIANEAERTADKVDNSSIVARDNDGNATSNEASNRQ